MDDKEIIIGLITLLVSILMEFLFLKKEDQKLIISIFRVIPIWFIITLLTILAFNTKENLLILQKIDSSQKYYNAKNIIENKADLFEKEIFKLGWDEINLRLDKINYDDEIFIDRKNVKEIWRMMFDKTESGSEIWATNCVIPSEWGNFTTSKELGIPTQKAAIKRRIKIKRVNLFDFEDKNHRADQFYIDSVLTRNLDSNFYESRATSLKRVENYIENQYDKRFTDMGICNIGTSNEILFMTVTLKNYNIDGAWVTTNKNKIKNAKKFYRELWEELK